MLKNIEMANRLIRLYPNAICFANIDAGLSLQDWEKWIREKRANPESAQTGIGIVSYNSDDELQKKFLMDIGIQCGYIKLKLGVEESSKILIATLKANEARGRRKFLRANCEGDTLSKIDVREGPIKTSGSIMDMSVVGFSCVLDTDPGLKKNTVLHDVQLKLRATLIRTQVVVFGTRESDGKILYVMLFLQLDNIAREKIRNYIQTSLQSSIEQEASTG
jgi:hypothetical protein